MLSLTRPVLIELRRYVTDVRAAQALHDHGQDLAARRLLKQLASRSDAEIASIDAALAVLGAAEQSLSATPWGRLPGAARGSASPSVHPANDHPESPSVA